MATINIVVTVANPGSGNRYYLDGVLQATISAIPGNTYKFDQADGTNSGHPLRLSITSNGTHSGGSAYTDGVTTSGTPGSGGAYTQIVVDATTVQTLYYYCTNHSGMGGSFNVGSSSTVQLQDRKGFDVQNFSADQTSVGQIYYNSASGTFKGVVTGGAPIGSWSSGGNLNTGRKDAAGFGEGYTASIAAGGYSGGGATGAQVESYNGTSWTETTEMSTQRGWTNSGAGTTTAGLIFGGQPLPPASGQLTATEEWGGSSWTNGGNLNQGRSMVGGAGTQTAALCYGGLTPSVTVNTEEYNGTAWTEVNNLPVANAGITSSRGSAQTNAFAAGGYSPAPTTGVIFYDGTNWTAGPSLNTGRSNAMGAGTSSLGIVAGGPPALANTEAFDGTSWTEVADLATGRTAAGTGGKSSTNALVFGGENPPGYLTATEEWAAADIQVKTLTTS
jgi:hypothetical protein